MRRYPARSVLRVALVVLGVACASQQAKPAPEPAGPAMCTCFRRDVIVSGEGGERAGSSSYLAMSQGCEAPRDTIAYAVLERILFNGLPGSSQPAAMIPDPEQARARSPQALLSLFGGEGLHFVTEFVPTPTGIMVTVSLDGLRRWLERNGVIRSFGLP